MGIKTLIRDINKTRFGIEGTMYYPLFNKKINVHFYDPEAVEYAQICAEYLCSMPEETLDRLCVYMIRYFEEFREYVGEDEIKMPKEVKGREILKYVYPNVLIIEDPENADIIGFHMECDCEWEIEHGLEFTIKDNKILYVGPFDDMPAWHKERLDYAGFYSADNDINMNYADREV